MASSVSSERAFSSAGITITKRRNRLKGDVVEALQFLKCTIRNDMIFRQPAPTSIFEEGLEVVEDDLDTDWVEEPNEKNVLIDLTNDDSAYETE